MAVDMDNTESTDNEHDLRVWLWLGLGLGLQSEIVGLSSFHGSQLM